MTNEARKVSEGLPVEETLDKPPPFPLQERGDLGALEGEFQRWLALRQQQRERVIHEKATQDPPRPVQSAQFKNNALQTVRTIFAFFVAAATGMLKMESEIPIEKIAQRNEMKEKEEEVTVTKLKEIEHHKWNLEEKIRIASRRENFFRISYMEDKEWEMSSKTAKGLVMDYGLIMAYLQKLVKELESGAKMMIIKRMVTAALAIVLFAVLCYGAYVSVTVTTVSAVTFGSPLALGIAMFCKHQAQVLFNNCKLVSECEQVKHELEKANLAYMKCKLALEDTLPGKKELLHVVDYEVSLYRSLQEVNRKQV